MTYEEANIVIAECSNRQAAATERMAVATEREAAATERMAVAWSDIARRELIRELTGG